MITTIVIAIMIIFLYIYIYICTHTYFLSHFIVHYTICSEASYNLVLAVELAVTRFQEAAAAPNLRAAQSAASAVCEAAEELARQYRVEGMEAR